MDGTMTVSQTLNLGAHIVATSTGSAKSVSNSTANDLYTCMSNKRKGIDALGEKRREERQRESVRLHTHTHTRAYMMNPFIDPGHDYGHRYDWRRTDQPWEVREYHRGGRRHDGCPDARSDGSCDAVEHRPGNVI